MVFQPLFLLPFQTITSKSSLSHGKYQPVYAFRFENEDQILEPRPSLLPSAPPLSRASLKPVKVKVGASEVQTHISPQTIEHFCFEVHSNRSFWFLKLISLGCKGNGKCASFQSQVYLLTHKQREWSRTWKEELVHVE